VRRPIGRFCARATSLPWYRHWASPSAVVRRAPASAPASRATSSTCSAAAFRASLCS